MSVPILLLAALSPPPTVAVAPLAVVAIDGRDIRLGDVVGLHSLAPAERKRLAERVIARVPEGVSQLTLSRAAVAGLARRSVPGLTVTAGEGAILLELRLVPVRSPACSALSRPISAGTLLAAGDVEPAECEGAAHNALRYDRRRGAVVAAGDLPAGTRLGPLRIEAAPAVAAGEALTLVSRAGPVSVARDVVALQPGRAGGRVFVRDADGSVISAPVAVSEDPQ